jgi:hypothetical protein
MFFENEGLNIPRMDVFWIIFIIAIIFHSSCQKYIYLKKLWNSSSELFFSQKKVFWQNLLIIYQRYMVFATQKNKIIHEKTQNIFILDGKLDMCIVLKNNNEVRTNVGQFLFI